MFVPKKSGQNHPNAPGHTTKDFTDLVSKLTTDQLLASHRCHGKIPPEELVQLVVEPTQLEKICSSNCIISPSRGEHKKCLSCHHLVVNLPTLTETNSKFAPENRAKTKRKRESIPSIHELRCHSLVSGRIHFTHTNSSNVGKYTRTYTM